MGQILAVAPIAVFGYAVARRLGRTTTQRLLLGLASGVAGGVVLSVLVLLGQVINLRAVLVQASPELFALLTCGLPLATGVLALLAASALMGLVGAVLEALPGRFRGAVLQAVIWIVLVGLLRELITTVLQNWGSWATLISWMFAASGLSVVGAFFLLVVVGGIAYWRYREPGGPAVAKKAVSARQLWIRRAVLFIVAIIVLMLPWVLGIFLSDVLDTVGLFILMGLGLNIVVGFAGLLDLGYVVFFAIGAYTMGVLTSPELAANPLRRA